ncbi:ubiquinol--cytochrome-c reductase subunit 8 [Cladophialophora chaetospira]|uniref:Cytochrome b-c1 complex subunit 8 n=1 Tax=Cladophialophora chaetospira TaxID=386627 RepID=A0AA39CD47_9EURO|nr:ubiquinol--cytochrome-c reductase subunit 8 [Cladophialophora chaetospira]
MEYNQDLPKGAPHQPVLCPGHKDLPAQRGIISYRLSSKRLNPLSHAIHNAIFNTFRRSKNQILYWAPPLLAAYLIMDWANSRNEYLNSKAGRAEEVDSE